jgi:hypothetical protein
MNRVRYCAENQMRDEQTDGRTWVKLNVPDTRKQEHKIIMLLPRL